MFVKDIIPKFTKDNWTFPGDMVIKSRISLDVYIGYIKINICIKILSLGVLLYWFENTKKAVSNSEIR